MTKNEMNSIFNRFENNMVEALSFYMYIGKNEELKPQAAKIIEYQNIFGFKTIA